MIRTLLNTLTFIITIIVVMFIRQIGPDLEAQLFPVITDQDPRVSRAGNNLFMENIMTKARNCPIVGITFQVVVHGVIEGRQTIVVNNVQGYQVGERMKSYPVGRVRGGPYTVTLPTFFQDADEIVGYALYQCHPLWKTPQMVGPFIIPPRHIGEGDAPKAPPARFP